MWVNWYRYRQLKTNIFKLIATSGIPEVDVNFVILNGTPCILLHINNFLYKHPSRILSSFWNICKFVKKLTFTRTHIMRISGCCIIYLFKNQIECWSRHYNRTVTYLLLPVPLYTQLHLALLNDSPGWWKDAVVFEIIFGTHQASYG